jgi:hypothetical protein
MGTEYGFSVPGPVARQIQGDEPLDRTALSRRLDEVSSELQAARKLLGSVRGGSPELLACVDRWRALADRLRSELGA